MHTRQLLNLYWSTIIVGRQIRGAWGEPPPPPRSFGSCTCIWTPFQDSWLCQCIRISYTTYIGLQYCRSTNKGVRGATPPPPMWFRLIVHICILISMSIIPCKLVYVPWNRGFMLRYAYITVTLRLRNHVVMYVWPVMSHHIKLRNVRLHYIKLRNVKLHFIAYYITYCYSR